MAEQAEEKKDSKLIEIGLELQAKDFQLSRKKHYDGEEGIFRGENGVYIQYQRYLWWQKNTKLFSLVLKNNDFKEEDIKLSNEHKKPLGMVQEFYDEFKKMIVIAVQKVNKRLIEDKEYPDIGKIRVILQGSYTMGFSQNPFKGDRYIPNWLFMPKKKSDYDFRCFASGLNGYVEKLRKDGKEIKDRSEFDEAQSHMIRPFSVGVIFPEFKDLENEFEEKSKKFNDGKEIRLQISLVTKNILFEPNPWDYEIEIE